MKSTIKRKLWTTLFLLAAGAGVGASCFMFGMAECYFPPQAGWKQNLLFYANLFSGVSVYSWLPVLLIQWCSKEYHVAMRILYGWSCIALLSQLGWLCCNG